ncbi:peptidase C39 family protein [Lutispora thermophila]|uniref:Peptidase_C39 like family protein n=1 Tax=Lutispora thermophila DSM 19022 TaxID=1122184 RepID=A0A1M6BEY9_9FIRM|nr:peptidase C39 family protein [Lutispora thermophila]SHI47275.1 Peptidase_C39 like family protein [Lutispora thermophila DSM 19022]
MKEIELKDITLRHKGLDFQSGICDRVMLNDKGQLELKENILNGIYTSVEVNAKKFKNIVAAWNAETPEGTEVEVLFKVRREAEWSIWFSYGKWSLENRASINNQKDHIAVMDIDTINILDRKAADGFMYKVVMRRNSIKLSSPKLTAISAALKLSDSDEEIIVEKNEWLKDLKVPERSQMVIPKIGNIICSPTSVAMIMEYYGVNIPTEDVALGVYDSGAEIYGNWSYNVAYAGANGFDAYIERYPSIAKLKKMISMDIPVVASIRTKDKEDIIGSPMAYPSGHLLVVRGFTIKDGEEYIIVNDPAAPDYDTVRREYRLAEFEKAWSGIVYILQPKSDNSVI